MRLHPSSTAEVSLLPVNHGVAAHKAPQGTSVQTTVHFTQNSRAKDYN